MPLCQICGREIAGDMLFCPYCGSKRTLDTRGAPVEAGEEKLVGSIPNVRLESGRSMEEHYTVLVTDKRTLFVQMTGDDLASLRRGGGLGGLTMLSGSDPDRGSGAPYADRYNEMTIDEALAETPGNFFLLNRDVRSLDLSSGEDGDAYVIRLRTSAKDLVLTMDAQHDHRDLLMAVFGDKVRW